MRTLHVDTGHEDRGGQRQVMLLAQALAASGHAPTVAVPRGAPLAGRLRDVAGVELVEAPLGGEVSLQALPQLVRLLRTGHFALAHAHTAHALTVLHLARRLAGLRRGLPVIAHRRVDFPLRRHPLARHKRAWPEAWIAVSAAVQAQLDRDGIDPSRVFIVPSALDLDRLRPRRSRAEVRAALQIPETAPALLTVGQLVAHKGHRVVLDALAASRRDAPDGALQRSVWIVAGEGPLLPSLRAAADRLLPAGAVRWLGAREDVGDLLAASDLVLFPSVAGEGSPAAPKEAMLAGVPILASDLAACRELGIEGDALLPVADVTAWAQRMTQVLADLPTARQAAMRRRPLAERFTPQATCAATLAVYAAVAGRREGAGALPRAGR